MMWKTTGRNIISVVTDILKTKTHEIYTKKLLTNT